MRIDANGIVHKEPGSPPVPSEVELCRDWLLLYATPATSCGRRSSYGLKHDVEKWAGRYVSNGAFILAALKNGYRVRSWPDSINATFFMSIRKKPRETDIDGLVQFQEAAADGEDRDN